MYGLGNTRLFSRLLFNVDHARAILPIRERNNLMVAPRRMKKVFCTVVRVPVLGERTSDRMGRPSDLLPWADPYIARLVQNLQEEVRYERSTSPLRAELEPPCPTSEPDWDWKEEPRWSFSDETSG